MHRAKERKHLILLGILAALGLVFFILPVTVKIVNIGNIAGTAICLILLAVSLRYDKFAGMTEHMRETPAGRIVFTLICAFLALCIGIAVVLSGLMIGNIAQKAPENQSCTVIVLGCKVLNGRPSLMLGHRIKAAYDYLNRNPAAKCIVSGGQGSDEAISEAECMKNELVRMGIDRSRIYTEDRSTSTDENIIYSMDIIADEGLSGNAVLITSSFHCFRACLISKKHGLDAVSYAAHTSWYLIPTYWLREWFGILYEIVLRH
ncbi:MAG: YdcF family protein [Oscillospiraceae bacterium]|nr:YdcF family protein [Oscillospiraceae bacterium]